MTITADTIMTRYDQPVFDVKTGCDMLDSFLHHRCILQSPTYVSHHFFWNKPCAQSCVAWIPFLFASALVANSADNQPRSDNEFIVVPWVSKSHTLLRLSQHGSPELDIPHLQIFGPNCASHFLHIVIVTPSEDPLQVPFRVKRASRP